MNIHLPAILMFTRGTRFWRTAIICYNLWQSPSDPRPRLSSSSSAPVFRFFRAKNWMTSPSSAARHWQFISIFMGPNIWGQLFFWICSIHIGVHIPANCRTAFSQCLGGGIKDIVTYLSPWCSVTHCSSQRGATEFAKLVNSNRLNLSYILVYIYIYICDYILYISRI